MTKVFYILFIFSFLLGCQNVKDGLTLQKQSGADEFLVKKKNPLVLPPEFNQLPAPENNTKKKNDLSSSDIEKLLNKDNSNSDALKVESGSNNIEQNILDKIKNK